MIVLSREAEGASDSMFLTGSGNLAADVLRHFVTEATYVTPSLAGLLWTSRIVLFPIELLIKNRPL